MISLLNVATALSFYRGTVMSTCDEKEQIIYADIGKDKI